MKVIRVTFRNGEQLMQSLPDDMSVPDWVNRIRIDGIIMGESWGAKWDDVAHWQRMSDVAADEKQSESPLNEQQQFRPIDDNVKRLAVLAGAGIFKPPGEA